MQIATEKLQHQRQASGTPTEFTTPEELLEMQCTAMNEKQGDMKGFECAKCLNKGLIYHIRKNEIVSTPCKCMFFRGLERRTSKSGMSEMLKGCTLESFETKSEWQQLIKNKAIEYIKQDNGDWWYIGGQVGSGKTHICTAIVGELINAGKTARYMLWRDIAVKLKSVVNDFNEYERLISPLKQADVLYIDDFFKTGKDRVGNTMRPTEADCNLAFEIINYRYNQQGLITIISSELGIDELLNIDEAIASRICQRAGKFCNKISKDNRKNYRLRGERE